MIFGFYLLRSNPSWGRRPSVQDHFKVKRGAWKEIRTVTNLQFNFFHFILTSGRRSSIFGIRKRLEHSGLKTRSQYWIQNTTKPLIWYLTWLIFIDAIFRPPEVTDIWRSNTFRIIYDQKKPRNEIKTHLLLDTSHDLLSLIF